MDWLSLALGFVRLANYFLGLAHDRQQFNAGYDKAVAETAMQTLRMTQAGKEIMAKLDGMTEKELDDVADKLGQKAQS